MSGVEVAGLALAILPLVVNQLDSYVRGLETIKSLRRYRWELETYSSNLSAQYAIFLNTLEIFLQDVIDDHDERSDLINHPEGDGWRDAQVTAALRQKLGRDYHAFTGTVSALCSHLEEISEKLGRQTENFSKAASIRSLGVIKFRKILSKAVYEDILYKIDKANEILKTLSEQSDRLGQARKIAPRLRKGLKRHRDGRRHARALYNILVQGQGWQCHCKAYHTVCFRLDANAIQNSRDADPERTTRFLMMLSAAGNAQHPRLASQWHEVELRPEIVGHGVSIRASKSDMSVSEGKRKVQFASSSTTLCVETTGTTTHGPGLIGDLCSTLGGFDPENSHIQQGSLGYLLAQDSEARYNTRLLRSVRQDITLHSLQDVLSGANPQESNSALSRRHRLYLAAVLACSVLQLQGSWLKQHWGTKDVLFTRDPTHGSPIFDHPYLNWKVASSGVDNSLPPNASKIQNEILIPLAIALIELSLGKTFSALYRQDDQDPIELQASYNTATRVLRNVYCESGSNYGDVVKECLYWSRNKGERFDDPQFEESVFDVVVSPLLRDFDYFEGISQTS